LRVSSAKEKAELQDMSVLMKTEESVTYGDPVAVFIRAGDPSACADVRRPKAPKMALPEGIVDADEPNVDGPKASCGGDTSLDEEVAETEVGVEVENKRLNEGEGATAKEMVDREVSEAGETVADVGRVDWIVFPFAAMAKRRTGVSFVLVLEVVAETEPDVSGTAAAMDLAVEVVPGADAEEAVESETVAEAEDTGVRVPVIVEAVEAAGVIPLEEAPEAPQEGKVMPAVDIEALDIVQTLGVEEGAGAGCGATADCLDGLQRI
jgi:hypothetical protein